MRRIHSFNENIGSIIAFDWFIGDIELPIARSQYNRRANNYIYSCHLKVFGIFFNREYLFICSLNIFDLNLS